MTFNKLYPLIHEIVFGKSNRIYVAVGWEERKEVGPRLSDTLDDLSIKLTHMSIDSWDICVEGTCKYIYFAMPYNFLRLQSCITKESAVIDLREA